MECEVRGYTSSHDSVRLTTFPRNKYFHPHFAWEPIRLKVQIQQFISKYNHLLTASTFPRTTCRLVYLSGTFLPTFVARNSAQCLQTAVATNKILILLIGYLYLH
jgi:hypothetical protein